MRKCFTLIELIVVVLIVGILVGFAMPGFIGAQKKAIDREARINLRLIYAAQKTHKLENGTYASCGGTAQCNNRLNLDLPVGGNWNYGSLPSGSAVYGTAMGNKGTSNWAFRSTRADGEPYSF